MRFCTFSVSFHGLLFANFIVSVAGADTVGHVALDNHFTEFRVGLLVVPGHLITSDTQASFFADRVE